MEWQIGLCRRKSYRVVKRHVFEKIDQLQAQNVHRCSIKSVGIEIHFYFAACDGEQARRRFAEPVIDAAAMSCSSKSEKTASIRTAENISAFVTDAMSHPGAQGQSHFTQAESGNEKSGNENSMTS